MEIHTKCLDKVNTKDSNWVASNKVKPSTEPKPKSGGAEKSA